ncbi:MAG: extensin family protein [Hyphomicrobiaceae bacterium]
MARHSRLKPKLMLVFLVLVTTTLALWLGLVPQRMSPFEPVDLASNDQWFLNLRLAALRRDKNLCRKTLLPPYVKSKMVFDKPIKKGCGWYNAVRLSEVGEARLSTGTTTCELAAALSMWMTHVVQPAARSNFGSDVARIDQMGTYSCRNIIGNQKWRTVRSQHAKANAIDISGFRLKNGRHIRVLSDWKKETPNGRFLRQIHRRSCRYFRVALSPNYNPAHKDHFHFDRGFFKACR